MCIFPSPSRKLFRQISFAFDEENRNKIPEEKKTGLLFSLTEFESAKPKGLQSRLFSAPAAK
jgi:hypothetical protein